MRDQSRRSGLDDAEKEYKRGLALRKAGDIDGCIQALKKASRAPKLRFATAWLIARLYRERDMMPAGARVARARRAGAGAERRGRTSASSTSWRTRSRKSGEVGARARHLHGAASPTRPATATSPTRIDRLTKVQAEGSVLIRRLLYVVVLPRGRPAAHRPALVPAFWEHNYFALAWPPLRTVPHEQLRARRRQRPRRRQPVRRLRRPRAAVRRARAATSPARCAARRQRPRVASRRDLPDRPTR